MDLENSELLLFAKCAEQCLLEYIVIGGFALYLNGINRATQDVDIWMKPTYENGKKLINTLICMGYEKDELNEISELDFTQPQVFSLNHELDILTQVHFRFDFDICFSTSRAFANNYGNTIHFLHLNELRELKVLARRPQDLRDVILIDDFLKMT
jgi:hypothetical protein